MIDMVDKMSNGVAVTTLKHIKHNIEKAREKDDSIDMFGCDRKALDMAIKALEQTRWIPVSERLPEEDGLYLVTDAFGAYPPYVLKREKASLLNCAKWATIVAWMPLPKPYEEGEDENDQQT